MRTMSPILSTSYRKGILCLVAILSFFLQGNAADNYVYLTDGTVRVFPGEYVDHVMRIKNTVSIFTTDGQVFTFLNDNIEALTETPLRPLPTITSFKFNNKYNYQVLTDARATITDNMITVKVACIGKNLTASFSASDDNAKVYINNKEVQSTVNRMRYESDKVLSTGYPGDLILKPGLNNKLFLMPYRKEYTLKVVYLTDLATSVPRIDINTVGGVDISSKDYYIDAQIIINGNEVFPSMTDSIQVKGRGNTSWSTNPKAKNPYRIKFAEKVKPFGMTSGKNWVLLANKMAGSMLTNAYGMKLASQIGTPSPNHMIPVELYVNGTYKGSYNFTEKVGLYNNSIDLDTENAAALLELDNYYDEEEGQKFVSSTYSIPVNIKEPEFGIDPTMLTLSVIKSRFNKLARAVYNGTDIAAHIDIDYLARYLLASDLILNKELFHPKSVYCYNVNLLNNDSLFIFGPMWDLDWGFGYSQIWSSYFNRDATKDFYKAGNSMEQIQFFTALRNDSRVARRMYELCRDFVNNDLDELCQFFDDYYQYAKPSLEHNKSAATDPTDYAVQSTQAVTWIRQRANYLYNKLKQEQLLPGDVNDDGIIDIKDVTMLIDYIVGVRTDLPSLTNADVNGDGYVDIADTSRLIDLLLNGSSS